jgi:hypothetical protein
MARLIHYEFTSVSDAIKKNRGLWWRSRLPGASGRACRAILMIMEASRDGTSRKRRWPPDTQNGTLVVKDFGPGSVHGQVTSISLLPCPTAVIGEARRDKCLLRPLYSVHACTVFRTGTQTSTEQG